MISRPSQSFLLDVWLVQCIRFAYIRFKYGHCRDYWCNHTSDFSQNQWESSTRWSWFDIVLTICEGGNKVTFVSICAYEGRMLALGASSWRNLNRRPAMKSLQLNLVVSSSEFLTLMFIYCQFVMQFLIWSKTLGQKTKQRAVMLET